MFFAHDGDPNIPFNMYEASHGVMIIIFLVLMVLFFVFNKKLFQNKYEERIRHGFGYFLIVLEIFYAIITIVDGSVYLPLHLCAISYYLTIILLFTKSEKVFNVLFFTGIIGGIVTFAIPELDHAYYNRFRFYQFIIAHTAIMIVPIYFLTNFEKDAIYHTYSERGRVCDDSCKLIAR